MEDLSSIVRNRTRKMTIICRTHRAYCNSRQPDRQVTPYIEYLNERIRRTGRPGNAWRQTFKENLKVCPRPGLFVILGHVTYFLGPSITFELVKL